jgi:hypothetical protein
MRLATLLLALVEDAHAIPPPTTAGLARNVTIVMTDNRLPFPQGAHPKRVRD